MRISFTAIVLSFLFIGLLSAEQIPRQPIEKFVLSNGMQVLLREDHRTPTIDLSVVFHAGSGSEKPGETGFAHLFEHMMFQGTENLPGDYVLNSAKYGGISGGWTSRDFTCFSDYIPSNCLERMLWMQSDRLANIDHSVLQERLDVQREVVKNERRQYVDNTPYSRVDETVNETAYPPDHPYSWETVGHLADLDHVTLEKLKAFFRRYYSPDNATLVLSGDFVSTDAKKLIHNYFASIPPGPGVVRLKQWIPNLSDTKRVVIEDNVGRTQLDYLWPMPPCYSREEAVSTLLSKCLAADASSRLTGILVEKYGLAAYVFAYGTRDELAGEYHIETTIHNSADAPRVEQLIDSVLTDIALHGVTERELEAVKKSYGNWFLDQLQSSHTIATRMFEYNYLLGDPDKFQWELDRYLNVTREDIQAFTARYLDRKPRVVVSCVPRGELRADTVNIDRKIVPPIGPETAFIPPAIQRATLTNGMQLLLVENHNLPLVSAQVFIRNGWSQDPEDRRGLSTITQALIDEETTTRSKTQLAMEMQKAGATVFTGEYSDGTTLNVNVMKTGLDRSLATIADIIMHPTFSQAELDKKKAKFLSFHSSERFNPEALAKTALLRSYFGERSAYAQYEPGLGTESAIKAVTRDEIIEFYRTHYSPASSAIMFAGDVTLAEATALAEKALGLWKAAPQKDYLAAPEANLKGAKLVLIDQPDATQSVIYIGTQGLPYKHPDFYLYSAMIAELCGMGTGDRINKVVREEKGFTYGFQATWVDDRFQGLSEIYGNVQTEHTAESVQEILAAMREIASQHPVTEQELETVRKSLIHAFPLNFTKNQDVIDMLSTQWRKELSPQSWTDFPAIAQSLDSASVAAAAAKHFHPDHVIIVVVGDLAKIEQPLRGLSLGEVVVIKPDDLQ